MNASATCFYFARHDYCAKLEKSPKEKSFFFPTLLFVGFSFLCRSSYSPFCDRQSVTSAQKRQHHHHHPSRNTYMSNQQFQTVVFLSNHPFFFFFAVTCADDDADG